MTDVGLEIFRHPGKHRKPGPADPDNRPFKVPKHGKYAYGDYMTDGQTGDKYLWMRDLVGYLVCIKVHYNHFHGDIEIHQV